MCLAPVYMLGVNLQYDVLELRYHAMPLQVMLVNGQRLYSGLRTLSWFARAGNRQCRESSTAQPRLKLLKQWPVDFVHASVMQKNPYLSHLCC